jgi:hypothetical protein
MWWIVTQPHATNWPALGVLVVVLMGLFLVWATWSWFKYRPWR